MALNTLHDWHNWLNQIYHKIVGKLALQLWLHLNIIFSKLSQSIIQCYYYFQSVSKVKITEICLQTVGPWHTPFMFSNSSVTKMGKVNQNMLLHIASPQQVLRWAYNKYKCSKSHIFREPWTLLLCYYHSTVDSSIQRVMITANCAVQYTKHMYMVSCCHSLRSVVKKGSTKVNEENVLQ